MQHNQNAVRVVRHMLQKLKFITPFSDIEIKLFLFHFFIQLFLIVFIYFEYIWIKSRLEEWGHLFMVQKHPCPLPDSTFALDVSQTYNLDELLLKKLAFL